MFNYTPFNAGRFNRYERRVELGSSQISDIVKFENTGLYHTNAPDDYIAILQDRLPMPTRIYNTTKNPRTNGKKIISSSWDERKIYFDIEICKPTEEELDAYIDQLKTILSKEEGVLQVLTKGDYRKYYATLTNQPFGEKLANPRNILNTTLEFTCFNKPFGEDLGYTYREHENVTIAAFQDSIVNNGSVEIPLYLKFYLYDGNTISSILIENLTSGQEIEITETFADDDILIIDAENEEVQLNGADIRFDGSLLYLDRGANTIKVTTTSSAHDYTLYMKTKSLYL